METGYAPKHRATIMATVHFQMLVLLYTGTSHMGFSQASAPSVHARYLSASPPDFWRTGCQLMPAQLPPSNTQELSPSEQPNNDERPGQKLDSYSRHYPDEQGNEGDSEKTPTMRP